jgi:hypothetical protein
MTVADIIDSRGAKDIADRTGVPVGRVRVWKHRQRIPRSIWPDLIDAYPELTLDTLKAAEAA